jgi:hypothetical protein
MISKKLFLWLLLCVLIFLGALYIQQSKFKNQPATDTTNQRVLDPEKAKADRSTDFLPEGVSVDETLIVEPNNTSEIPNEPTPEN